MICIDLNCDAGESFGAYRMGADEAVFPHVTSANIACGFHAGDAATMRRTIALAHAHGVAIGAHPGLPDLTGFGRRAMRVTPEEVYEMVVYQAGALFGFARAAGVPLRHVKPHGALYNMAAADAGLATAIAQAVRDLDAGLVLYGLSGSALIAAGEALGLATANEVFADRNYLADGTLVPRGRANALITDAGEAARRALRMARDGCVRSVEGAEVIVRAETICIHGDAPCAPEFARRLREVLTEAGISVRAPEAAG